MKNFKTYRDFILEAYTDEERKALADKGFALSDGSFPIKNLDDLKNAIQAYGRAKDQVRAAKFIVKRAKALGAEDLIPDTPDFQKSLGESILTEAVLTIPGMAAMLLGLGMAAKIGFMSDEKYNKMVGSIKPTAKAIVRSLPIIGNKVRDQELKDYQTQEIEKYLKDEISDKDIVAILNENPKLKKAIEDVATGGLNYKDYYRLIKELGGAANKYGDAHSKFKQLRKKISDGKVLESVVNTQVPAKTIAIQEGKDIGSWNQGGLKANKNVLVTTFVGPPAIEEFGLGRNCMQINVGRDYVQLNPADIVELKDILKSYKVK